MVFDINPPFYCFKSNFQGKARGQGEVEGVKGGEETFYNPNAVKTLSNILSSILSVLVSKGDRSSFKGAPNPHFQFHVLPDNPLPCVLDSSTTDSITFPFLLHTESQKRESQLPPGPGPTSTKPTGKKPWAPPPIPALALVKHVSSPEEP